MAKKRGTPHNHRNDAKANRLIEELMQTRYLTFLLFETLLE